MRIIDIKNNIEKILDDNKAQNITCIDLKNKSYIADYMIVASGTSSRHLQAVSEILVAKLKELGIDNCRIEGKDSNDWKLVDTQDIIVHIFHPEKREFHFISVWSPYEPFGEIISILKIYSNFMIFACEHCIEINDVLTQIYGCIV